MIMLTARRVLAFLFIGAIAASSADAFKPSVQKNLSLKSVAAADSFLDNPADVDRCVNKLEVIRGGETESIIKSADVVKAHGYAVFFFAAVFFLDTLGVKTPLIGPESLIPGYNSGDTAVKFLTRFMCGLWTGMGMMELEFCETSAMQDIFKKFHIVFAPVLLWTMREIGGEGIHWLSPIIVTLFGVGMMMSK